MIGGNGSGQITLVGGNGSGQITLVGGNGSGQNNLKNTGTRFGEFPVKAFSDLLCR